AGGGTSRRGVGPVTDVSPAWTDTGRPLDDRVDALLAAMTLDEKLAQLGSATPGAVRERVHGLGHITRAFGGRPVEPAEGARQLRDLQGHLVANTRLGVPAIAHEECLAGLMAYRASVFPSALALAATFDPERVGRMAAAIGAGMRALGVHQGLSPLLDVVRDYRWGRVEETFGEDPYLVGVLGT